MTSTSALQPTASPSAALWTFEHDRSDRSQSNHPGDAHGKAVHDVVRHEWSAIQSGLECVFLRGAMSANKGRARLHAVRYEQGGMHGMHPLGHSARWAWYVHPLLFARVSGSDSHPSKTDRRVRFGSSNLKAETPWGVASCTTGTRSSSMCRGCRNADEVLFRPFRGHTARRKGCAERDKLRESYKKNYVIPNGKLLPDLNVFRDECGEENGPD